MASPSPRRLPLRASWPARLANRLALVNGLQLLLVAGGLGLLSFSLGRRSGLESSEIYRQNASVVDLSSRLSAKLSYPLWINQLNLLKLSTSHHGIHDVGELSQTFWRQMQVFPVDYINFGGVDGSFVGMERTSAGELRLNEDTSRSGRGVMTVYAMNANGARGALLERIPGMTSTHQEAWFVETARAGKPLWSSIYSWEDQPEVFSISYNAPLFGPDRKLAGVVGVDVVLSHLSAWLSSVWRERQGLALIVEPSGALVASSEPSLTLRRDGNRISRAQLSQLHPPLAKALAQRFGQLMRSNKPQREEINGLPYTLQATPWGRDEGLNWLLLTALAVDPANAAAERNSVLALLAAGTALVAALLLINRQIQALLFPVQTLEATANALSQALERNSASPEPQQPLAFSSGLQASAGLEIQALESSLRRLVEGYNSLTTNLRASQERERRRDAETLHLLQDKLRSSLQAAAIAHEINQPLSVLLLHSELLLAQVQVEGNQALPQAWHQPLATIRAQAERVVLTIEKMRALLRNVQTEQQTLDLRQVARSALLYMRSNLSGTAPTIDSLELETTTEPAWIEGDAVQVQIAIVNLLRNAAEALRHANHAQPWIGIRLQRQGVEWWLEVADNGPGCPATVLEAQPLQTNKPDGSGLGLFVVRTTMENHHGSLEIARSEAGGALLRLRFPATGAPQPTSALPTTGD